MMIDTSSFMYHVSPWSPWSPWSDRSPWPQWSPWSSWSPWSPCSGHLQGREYHRFVFFLCLRKLAVLVQWRVASTYYSLQITALPTTSFSSSNPLFEDVLGLFIEPQSDHWLALSLTADSLTLVCYNSCFGDLIELTLTLADGDAYSNVVHIVSDVTVAIEESLNNSLGTACQQHFHSWLMLRFWVSLFRACCNCCVTYFGKRSHALAGND